MTKIQKIASDDLDWRELPLLTLLYEWFLKNVSIRTTEFSTVIAYIGLFLITWYTVVWMTRFIVSIIWPLFLIASALIVFRVLQFYGPEEITDIVKQSFNIVADTLASK